jgi:hypothetical protein
MKYIYTFLLDDNNTSTFVPQLHKILRVEKL